jgi:hypothetical protein
MPIKSQQFREELICRQSSLPYRATTSMGKTNYGTLPIQDGPPAFVMDGKKVE